MEEKRVSLKNILIVLLIGLLGYILGVISTMLITHNIIDKMFRML